MATSTIGLVWPTVCGSHSIRTVSDVFQKMDLFALSLLVPWSDIASFAVERCAAHQQPIYGHLRMLSILPLNHNQQFEAPLHARDESTSLFAFEISFVFHCINLELVSHTSYSIA